MPSQFLYQLMSYGSIAVVVAAIVVGAIVTTGAVRKLLIAAVVVTLVRFLLNYTLPPLMGVANEATAFAYGLVQTLLSVGEVLLLVGAAVVGARTLKAKDAAIAAMVDPPTETWRQPENSPDPRLLAD